MTDTTESAAPAQASLTDLRMPELQALATRLGIAGLSKMRKPELVEAIRERRRASGPRSRPPEHSGSEAPEAPAQQAAPEQGRNEEGNSQEGNSQEGQAASGGETRPRRGNRRSTSPAAAPDNSAGAGKPETSENSENQTQAPAASSSETASDNNEGSSSGKGRTRTQGGEQRNRQQRSKGGSASNKSSEPQRAANDGGDDGASDQKMASLDEIIHFPEPTERPAQQENARGNRRRPAQNAPEQNNDGPDDGSDDDERSGRRRRGRDRYRDRKRRQTTRESVAEDDVEILEDDVLVPVAGILDVLENYAFVRTSGYMPGSSDVYVSLGQVKKAGMRRGDAVTGAVRQPREGEGQRQKFNALVRLDSINGAPVEDALSRPDFADLTPIHPDERLRLETDTRSLTGRVLDLVAPIGKGQRGLLVAAPGAGTTTTLQHVATAVATNHPEVHLMVVLIDERPEEVTDWERAVAGEVIASTFDRPASDHTTVAELAIERAKRLVELGQDVVLLLDSLTALARAYNLAAPPSGRVLAGGVDAGALYPPKKFFGAARNLENGGSLTILASELIETGSATDEVIATELTGTASSHIRLSRGLVDKRTLPPIDVTASGTTHEEAMLTEDELVVLRKVRRVLAGLEPHAAADLLLTRIRQSGSNAELLLAASRADANKLN